MMYVILSWVRVFEYLTHRQARSAAEETERRREHLAR
jgi:hypothetical protein